MILTGQLRHLMRGLWSIHEQTPTHLVCRSFANESRHIEVFKGRVSACPDLVEVIIPLEHGSYKTTFSNEMSAYEYLEDFVMEPIDKQQDILLEEEVVWEPLTSDTTDSRHVHVPICLQMSSRLRGTQVESRRQ